jgi:lysophospholipase
MTLVSTPGNSIPANAISGMIKTSDGVDLRFARWDVLDKNRSRGTVCVFNGRTEFIEKYSETIGELLNRGFAVATMDWRGQGHSSRQLTDSRKGYVEDFSQFETDVDAFMDQVVIPNCPKPYYALAHSTGGAVLLRVAHSGKPWFERFVLSAPMIDLVGEGGSTKARILARALRLVGLGKIYMPFANSGPDEAARFIGNTLTSDEPRFKRNVAIVEEDPTLAIGGPTVAWLSAAFDAFDEFQDAAYPAKIRQPILILGAGSDTIVSTEAGKQMADRLQAGEHRVIENSKHEILQEKDAVRKQFWDAFDAFMK